MASVRKYTWWYAARRDVDRAAVRLSHESRKAGPLRGLSRALTELDPRPLLKPEVYMIPVTALAAPAVIAVTSGFQVAVTACAGRAFVSENDGVSTLMFERADFSEPGRKVQVVTRDVCQW